MPIHIKKTSSRDPNLCRNCARPGPTLDDDPINHYIVVSYGPDHSFKTNLHLCLKCFDDLVMTMILFEAAGAQVETNPGAPPIRNWGELTKKPDRFIQAKMRAAAKPGLTPTPAIDFISAIAEGRLPERCPDCLKPTLDIDKRSKPPAGSIKIRCSACGWEFRIIESAEG